MYEKTIGRKHIFSGRILNVEVLNVELEDGKKSSREVVRHRGAVAVLVQTEEGVFILVRQFRKPIEQDLLEIVAGTREEGESAEETARREVREETGASKILSLEPLGYIFSAPGFCSERLELYLASVEDASIGPQAPDEDEHVETVRLDECEIDSLIAAGKIHDSKTLAAWAIYRGRYQSRKTGKSE